jgi:methyl-accepting chemotaxis protein
MTEINGRLNKKLLLIYLPVLVVVLGFIAFSIFRQAGIEARKNFISIADILQKNMNIGLNLWIEDNARIARLLSQEKRITNVSKQPQNDVYRQEAYSLLKGIYQNNQAIENLSIVLNINRNQTLNISALRTLKYGEPFINVNKISEESKKSTKILLDNILEKKKTIVSPVFYSDSLPTFYLLTPIIDGQNILGAVVMQLKLNYFTQRIVSLYQNSDDQTSIILFNADSILVNQNTINTHFKPNELFAKQEGLLFYHHFNKEKNIFSYRKMDLTQYECPELWYIGVFQPSRFINDFVYGKLSIVIPIILLMLIIYGSIIIYTTKRFVITPLNKTAEEIKKLADGNLTTQETHFTKDEIGYIAQQIYEAKQNLSIQIVGKLQEKAINIDSQNKVVMEITENLVQNANEEAASIEEISATTEEFLSMAKQNAEITNKNTQDAQNLGASLEILTKSVKQTVDALIEISEHVSIIDEIASKTDLLSINAAIEASRSGESGKGFAVVAEEIKKLASKTSKASAQIKTISNASKNKASKTIAIIEMAVPKIRELVDDLKRINEAVKEQENGVVQINATILQLSATSQSNLSRTEKLSGTVKELGQIVVDLNQIAHQFKTNNTSTISETSSILNTASEILQEKTDISNIDDNESIEDYQTSSSKTHFDNLSQPTKININLQDDDFESY